MSTWRRTQRIEGSVYLPFASEPLNARIVRMCGLGCARGTTERRGKARLGMTPVGTTGSLGIHSLIHRPGSMLIALDLSRAIRHRARLKLFVALPSLSPSSWSRTRLLTENRVWSSAKPESCVCVCSLWKDRGMDHRREGMRDKTRSRMGDDAMRESTQVARKWHRRSTGGRGLCPEPWDRTHPGP